MRPAEVRDLLQMERPVLRRADRALSRAADVEDLRLAAARRWPKGVRDYVEGGADGEVTLHTNRAAYDRLELIPKVLRDVAQVDTEAVVLGSPSALPLALGPTGYSRMMHPDGELAVARAAASMRVPYAIATMSTVALEDLPRDGEQWFQLYMWRDRSLVEDLLARAQAHGCGALMLTVDTAVTGHRLRDTRNGFALPPRLTPRTVLGMARRPAWCAAMLRGEPITFANVPAELAARSESVMEFAARQFDPSVTWRDLEWLRERWPGVLSVKGVVDADDAVRAVDLGADAVVLSNHGGRQLDRTAAPLEVLPAVRDRLGDAAEVLVDSGLRRGSDLAIALALGADAGLLGRAYLYGLGAGGEAGVVRVLEILAAELAKAMRLLGVVSLAQLRAEGTSLVRGRRAELSGLTGQVR